jgi:hypothetical protein
MKVPSPKSNSVSMFFSRVGKFIRTHQKITSVIVVLLVSVIFILRNVPAFTLPNFYAEDATILFQNVYTKDILSTLTSAFNGYLVVGLYLLAYIAVGVNHFLGGGLVTLPVVTAFVSCLFFGLVASLPYILFRNNLGIKLSLLTVLFTALVPLGAYDYAILGTLGNLKFLFLYIAFLFVIYRLIRRTSTTWRYVVIDSVLLLCALSNATVAFLLPIILLPYILNTEGKIGFKKIRDLQLSPGLVSAVALVLLSVIYTLVALLKGIPKLPGYLDSPFKLEAVLPILDRSTYYAFSYPFTASMNSYFVVALSIAFVVLLIRIFMHDKSSRYVVLTACWAILLGTGLFVINRPGIGDLYLTYLHKGGPDQFFMAQNMIFIFLIAWLIRKWFNKQNLKKAITLGVVTGLYLIIAIPHGTSYGANSTLYYKSMMPIGPNIEKACKQYADEDKVILQVYPVLYWLWYVDRDLACD